MTPLAEILDQLKDEVPHQISVLVKEIADHRDAVKGGAFDEGPSALHQRLLEVVAAQDRCEEILASIGRLRASTAQAVDECQDSYDDAYAQAVTAKGHTMPEFSTGKEREARYSLLTLQQKIDLRKAQKLDRAVGSALDYCRLLHNGIDRTRRSLDTRIRLITLEGQLEH